MTKLKWSEGLVAAAATLCAMLSISARAQKLPTATAPGAYIAVGGTYSEVEAQYPQRLLGGAGVYADLNIRTHFGIEAEIRWLRQNQVAGSHETTYLIGPRVELHKARFSPYLKGLVGNGNLTFPYGYGYGNYLVYGGGGGLDVGLTRRLTLRAVDFEYQKWPQFSLGTINPYGVSAGLSCQVYHTGGWRKHRYK